MAFMRISIYKTNLVLIVTLLIFQDCTFRHYIIQDSVYPKLLGKIITRPTYKSDGIILKEDNGLMVIEYKSGLQEHITYKNGKIINSFLIENGEKINDLTNDSKEGIWHKYIPKTKLLIIEYYKSNQLKYSFSKYLGETIKLNIYDDTLIIQKNDTICFGFKDTSYKYLSNHSKINIKYLELYKKNRFSYITYSKKDNPEEEIELTFYKRNRLSEMRTVNLSKINKYNKPETKGYVIFDNKGNKIFKMENNVSPNFDTKNRKIRKYCKNSDRLFEGNHSFIHNAIDYKIPMKFIFDCKNKK